MIDFKSYIYSVFVMLTAVLVLGGCGDSKVYMTGDRSEEHAVSDDSAAGEMAATGIVSDDEAHEDNGESAVTDQYTDDFYVYLTGAVCVPGVYAVPAGSRLYEAVEMAGGFTDETDISACNLAAEVSDGVQYYFPTYAETEAAGGTAAYIVSSGQNMSGGSSAGADGRVNINTASRDELMTLPGIGGSKADAIIAYRDSNEGFSAPEDIKNVKGIGDSTYESLKDYITVK
ncbi:MAG: helix-hairpin-helix domain-containing protein [Lachnospiraceae bacterium]|nr:helix-hairpin-helix domain-containing protein [Lachnospiraceae bacterium]